MSSFECPVVTVAIEEHPNADRLEVAVVDGWRVVVASGAFTDGDAAVYIPEASILPGPLIAELGLDGRLAGPSHNRVKALRLRGELSQGLLVSLDSPHFVRNGCRLGRRLR
ncbi:MAG: hypothetical protein OXF75_03455 [Acidimicrobiaceae bacterium]|nr:hypothetical protein [Acidimicrobiaceae bacterium]